MTERIIGATSGRRKVAPKVLCIDDASLVRTLVRSVLAKDGINVITAASGAEGIELMVGEKPDAVLLDIRMPIMDGLEMLKLMAGDAELAQIPVMMLTGHSDEENVREALALGARDFIVKPFDHQMFRQRVRRLLELRGQPTPTPARGTLRQRFTELPDLRLAKKVLVVDDQPANLGMAQELLGERYDICTARTGAGALVVAARERPDLILVDLYMPIMDGLETLHRLRQMSELADTRIVAMRLGTAEEEPFLAEFDGAVRKPLQRSEVLTTFGEILGLPGLFSFAIRGLLTVLRLHRSRLWGRADLDALYQQVEFAFAKLLETGQTWFVVDVSDLVGLNDEQIEAAVGAVRTVIRRANECKLDCKVVVPPELELHFDRFQKELGVEVCLRVDEAIRKLERQAERRASQTGLDRSPDRRARPPAAGSRPSGP